jgi:Short C-terminal domain
MRGRKIGITALLVIATLLWTGFGLGLWAKRQLLDTDNWVETSDQLLEDEEIRVALGNFIVDRVYASAAVEERARELLPDRLDPLAGPAANAVKEVARRNAPRVLGSDAALNAWNAANSAAHDTLIRLVEGDLTDGGLALKLDQLVEEVATENGLPAEVADRLPPDVAQLQIARPDQLDTAKEGVDLFETVVWVLLVLAVAAFAGAIALSRDRRRTIVTVGGCLILAGIALLAVRRLAGNAIVEALADAPNAHAVADDVWEIATSLLVDAAQGSMLFGAFVLSGAWLAGAGRRATGLRRAAAPSLREHPGVVRAGLGVAILLLVIWGPVPWTQRLVTVLIFTVGAFAWLEWIRNRTVEEFPDVRAGELSRRAREGMASLRSGRPAGDERVATLERLANLHERGVLDDAEFKQQKAAVLSGG